MLLDGRGVLDPVGCGPPLLCLPGGPGFPGAQLGDLGGVSRSRELLRLDWRGAGASVPPADGRHAIDDYATDLAAIQDELGIERWTLFGHSFGGLVAATFAARHPDRVGRLVLDATPDRMDDGRAPHGGIAGYFVRWDAEAQRYAEQIMGSLYEPAATWFQENELTGFELGPVLGSISAPTLVITGDQDWAVGPARAAAMADAIPHARLSVIADAGHFAWLEQPVAYAASVLSFLGDS
jgi:proline iminopeptidase